MPCGGGNAAERISFSRLLHGNPSGCKHCSGAGSAQPAMGAHLGQAGKSAAAA